MSGTLHSAAQTNPIAPYTTRPDTNIRDENGRREGRGGRGVQRRECQGVHASRVETEKAAARSLAEAYRLDLAQSLPHSHSLHQFPYLSVFSLTALSSALRHYSSAFGTAFHVQSHRCTLFRLLPLSPASDFHRYGYIHTYVCMYCMFIHVSHV